MSSSPDGLGPTYRDLHTNLDAAFRRAQDGLRACKATLLFLQQTAALEESFGTSMVKVGESFAGIHEQNGPSLNKAIASICSAIQGLGRQHSSLSAAVSQDVCRSMATFTEQQAEHVRRTISETQALVDDIAKERALHRKVRDKYRRACRDAETVIKQAALKGGRSEAVQLPAPATDVSSPTDGHGNGLQKIDALWSKMWDQLQASASGAGLRSVGERATEALEALKEAEAEYDASRRLMEEKEAQYRQAVENRLTHFEANEESRALLVKTQLQRLQSCRRAALDRIDRSVLRMIREAAETVDVPADYAVYLGQMAKPPPADAGLDVSMDLYTQPSLAHIDRCVKNLRGLCHCFSELAAAEEMYGRGLAKLAEKAGYPDPSPPDAVSGKPLRRASPVPLRVGPARFNFRKFVEREGPTMREAWEAYMRGNHAIARLHLAMSSRVAESVCVTLAQTQDELSGTRQEVAVAQTAALKTFTATRSSYLKARDRAEHRSRDLQDKVDELRGIAATSNSSSDGTAEAAGGVQQASSSSSSSSGGGRSRLELRLVVLREEVQASELALDQATAALKDEKASLVTEVEIILKALGEREEDRLGKMKMALGELYHMQSQAHASTIEEEEKRGESVAGISVGRDLGRFVAEAVGRGKDETVQAPREAMGEPRYSALLQSRLQTLLQILREEEGSGAAQATPSSTTPRAEPSDLQVRYSDLSNGLIGRTSLLPHSMSLDNADGGGLDLSASLATAAASSSSSFLRRSLDGSVSSMDVLSFLSDDDDEDEEDDDEEGAAAARDGPDARQRADATVGTTRGFDLVLDGTTNLMATMAASPRELMSPARATIRSRTTSAQALATDRLPDSMSPRPTSQASPRPFLNSPGRAPHDFSEAATAADPAPPLPPRPEKAAGRQQAHAELLFPPPNQTMTSSLFRGIELRQSATDHLLLDQQQQDPEEEEEGERRRPPSLPPAPKHSISNGDRSAFRPITPQPLSQTTASAGGGAGGGGTSIAEPSAVMATREGRSNSLTSSISSSLSRSLSLTLQRPTTPQQPRSVTTPQPTDEAGGADATAAPPLPADDGSSEEIKIFNLPPTERVIESYSCALLPNNLLIHGRLFVTQRFVCFGSWGTTRLVLSIDGIDFIEKANTMGFVPNALWLIMKAAGERYFFSSFLYRDNCFDLIQRLLPKRLSTIELKTLPEKLLDKKLKQPDVTEPPPESQPPEGGAITPTPGAEPPGSTTKADALPESQQPAASAAGVTVSSARRVSFEDAGAASTTPTPTTTTITATDGRTPPPAPAPSPAPPLSSDTAVVVATKSPPPMPSPPPPVVVQDDTVIRRMTVLTAETLETTIDTFLRELWGQDSSFYLDYLQERGDRDIVLGGWESRDEMDVYSGESFAMVREVRYNRNRAGETVGPRMALTRECQMYRLDYNGDRAVLTTVLSFTGIPYCDYFSVQTRWILTRVVVGLESHCRLQVGLDVVFKQNLLLKAAIRAGTEGEMKRVLQNYLGKAKARLRTAKAAADALLLLQPSEEQQQLVAEALLSSSSVLARSRGSSLLLGATEGGNNGGVVEVVGTTLLPNGAVVGSVVMMSSGGGGTQPLASGGASMAAMMMAAVVEGQQQQPSESLVRRVSRALSEPTKTPGGRGVEVVRQVLEWALRAATATLNAGLPLTDGLVVRDVLVMVLGLAVVLLASSLARVTGRLGQVTAQLTRVMEQHEETVKQLAALQQQLLQQQQRR